MRKVEVVPHNPQWQNAFKVESKLIAKALGQNIAAIHHIGSTAIPNIYAKPIIDLLVEVQAIARLDEHTSVMELLGYEVMGAYGIPGRRYFRKHNPAGIRTHHVHTFIVGSAQLERHLMFRDYMIAHPDVAQQYSQLKRQLAQAHPQDIEAYMDGKDGFIKAIDREAAQWRTVQINP
ncbi:MAG: GrpB family protein [Cyanothece sp. SIO1E1]|nr:GrpB family protein [Cyanothece sp. SIO1E1]